MEDNMLTIDEIFRRLKKHLVLILIIAIAFPLIGGVYYIKTDVPKYQCSAKLFIGKKINDENSYYNSGDINLYQNLMATYVELIKTEDLIKRALDNENIENITPNYVISGLSVALKENTQILDLAYTSYTPELSKRVLDSVINEFIYTSKALIPNVDINTVVESKLPVYPIKSRKNIVIVATLVLGIMIGASISLLIEAFNSKIKSDEEIEMIIGAPVIGSVPEYNNKIFAKENKRGGKIQKCSTSKKKKKVAMLKA